jgi:hypothetical protein
MTTKLKNFDTRIIGIGEWGPVRRAEWAPWPLGVALVLCCGACGTNPSSQAPDASPGLNSPGASGSGSGANSSGSGSGGTVSTSGGTGGSGSGGGAAGEPLSEAGSAATVNSDASAGSSGSGDGATGTGDCTREGLTSAINAYFAALAAHDPTKAPLASTVKYTEDGMQMDVGQGEWKTAGAVKFKRSALDTQICESATESVIPDTNGDIVYGLRLKLVSGQITEIETIPVRSYITINPAGLVSSASDDWETVLPAAQQPTRDGLQAFIDTYFNHFPNGACNFASDCMRLEDGASIGSCTGAGVGCVDGGSSSFNMTARIHILDVEAGISVGFTMFAGTYTDFHLLKVRSGQVHGVHAVLSSASSSGWN